jgi:hypothetical protein
MVSSVSPAEWLDMVRGFLGRCSENGAFDPFEQNFAKLLLTTCPTNLGQVIATETAPALLQVTNRLDVAFIFSQPLVKSNADPTPIDTLNFDVERQHILGMLRTHITKEIRFRVYSGNFNSLVSCMSDRVSVLFFSGHISETNHSLCFEDGIGGCVFVYPHQLKNYFPSQQNKDSHSLRLVVLMSCFSENAGRAFINYANVEFVVCIRKDATVSDSVATQFSTAFCTALFKGGFEVRHCFETAKQIVASISPDEAKKFLLLEPQLAVLRSNQTQMCFAGFNNGEARDLTPVPQFRDTVAISSKYFVGRKVDMYQILHQLTRTRVVTIRGPAAMGKTMLAHAIGRHIVDHMSFEHNRFHDGVLFVDLRGCVSVHALLKHVYLAILVCLPKSGKSDDQVVQKTTELLSNIVALLKAKDHLLIILDQAEGLSHANADGDDVRPSCVIYWCHGTGPLTPIL